MAKVKKEQLSNARRFINAYNNIDYALKSHYSLNRSIGFSEMIRKTVVLNYIVRKNEEVLIDYGRLRNAIVHNSNEEIIIAEPHDSVVENIERIERLLTTPPKALDTVCRRDVLTIDASKSMKDVIKLIAQSSYSSIENSNYYVVAPASFTVEEALNEFHRNSKLLAILITKEGKTDELPLGIMTGTDVIEMNKILETY